MRRKLNPIVIDDFHGGRDGKSNALKLPSTKMQEVENWYVDRDDLVTRNGYLDRLDEVLAGGNALQSIHQHKDNAQSRAIIYTGNGVIYRDDGNARTDITNGLTISNNRDARVQVVNFDGQLIGTDDVNELFHCKDTASLPTTLQDGVQAKNMPTRARSIAVFKEHLFMLNVTFNGADYPFMAQWSDPSADIPLSVWDNNAFNDLNRNHVGMRMVAYQDCLIFFQDQSIHYCYLDPGNIESGFNFRILESEIGLAAVNGVWVTREGTFFISDEGRLFWIAPFTGLQPPRPIYIGKPMEDFMADVNDDRLAYVCAAEIPEIKGVLFGVPYGSNQLTNNRGVFLNYDEWSRVGGDRHPAFSIWSGRGSQEFAFNALSTIRDGNTRRCLGADYGGKIYNMNQGLTDNGTAIRPILTTPQYGDRNTESIWYEVMLTTDNDSEKQVSITQKLYGEEEAFEQVITAGEDADVLAEDSDTGEEGFDLEVDFLGGETSGKVVAEMEGNSLYTELTMEVLSGLPMSLRALVIRREPGSDW